MPLIAGLVVLILAFFVVGAALKLIFFLLGWLIFGFIIGWLAHQLVGGTGGFWSDVLLGILGTFVGGVLGALIPILRSNVVMHWVAALLGACILLLLQRSLVPGRRY